jgi:hypothetical protein
MSRLLHRSIPLAFAVTALLVVALPQTAAAAPGRNSATAARRTAAPAAARSSASSSPAAHALGATGAAGVCALPGLVRTDGSRCADAGRARRQILGLPNPLHYLPNPVHVIKKVAGGVATTAFKAVALVVLVGWVASGAESALKGTAEVISSSTKPELTSSWFSASYWRIAAIAALLTLPFLCAAAIHALVRSDLGLLTRAAFGYLPLSLLAVGIASQLTMLLLSATDEMSAIIASASGHADGVFLARTSVEAIASSIAGGDPFVGFLAAIVTVAAALTLWVELLVRDAAVYVIVLMLPLFFAAMVWPARRMLAIRAIETLIALILSKFAIVAVLALGGTALGHSLIPGPAEILTGATLVLLAAFSPWALLRVLPLHEVASAAAGGLSQGLKQGTMSTAKTAVDLAGGAAALTAEGAEWLRPRMLSEARSALDGSRYRDAHRSAAPSDPDPAPDPIESRDAAGDLEPVAAGVAGGPLSGGDAGGADDAASSDWSWPQRSSSVSDAGAGGGGTGGTGGGGAGGRGAGGAGGGGRTPGTTGSDGIGTGGDDAGGPVRSATGPAATGPAATRPAGTGPAAGNPGHRGALLEPDGERFPFALNPELLSLVIEDDLRALADRATANASDHSPGSASDSLKTPPSEAEVEPPPQAGHDPVGPPPPPPGNDPVGLPTPASPTYDPEPPADGADRRAR